MDDLRFRATELLHADHHVTIDQRIGIVRHLERELALVDLKIYVNDCHEILTAW